MENTAPMPRPNLPLISLSALNFKKPTREDQIFNVLSIGGLHTKTASQLWAMSSSFKFWNSFLREAHLTVFNYTPYKRSSKGSIEPLDFLLLCPFLVGQRIANETSLQRTKLHPRKVFILEASINSLKGPGKHQDKLHLDRTVHQREWATSQCIHKLSITQDIPLRERKKIKKKMRMPHQHILIFKKRDILCFCELESSFNLR